MSTTIVSTRALRISIPLSLMIVLLACAPGAAFAQSTSPFLTGATALQTNILIFRCSGSEHGGTSQFASRLIGEREVLRRQATRGRDRAMVFGARDSRRSINVSEQSATEAAVLPSEIEQLADLTGYLKLVSSPAWMKVRVTRP